MSPALVLPFPVQPDLAATMDIQIPALAWQPAAPGRFRRVYHLDDHPVEVTVAEADGALHFFYDPPAEPAATRLAALLAATFPTQIADLDLGAHPALAALGAHYAGTVIMHADPFEALVLTVLSQNRTGEAVRAVYPRLDAHCQGIDPVRLAGVDPVELRALIRAVGPYKAPRLHQTAARVTADGEDAFRAAVVDAPGADALAYLQTLPGIGHKTAACILVFSARTTATLPVDTHLFRVVDRLGLARHGGRLNAGVRDRIIATLLCHGPDLALAHFLFLLLGRTTCTTRAPACGQCVMLAHCPHARCAALTETLPLPAPAGAAP